MTRPLAVAHRGFSASFPENSLVGADAAIAAGCDLVEADARLAADGTLWCVHDASLDRLAGRAIAVAEADSATLAGMVLHSGERLVTLAQMLDHVGGRVPVLIDVKTTDLPTARVVVEAARASGLADRIWFGFRAAPQVGEAKRLLPGARCLGFLPDYETASAFEAAGAQALRVWEGHMDEPSAARLFDRCPVWVTAGGHGTAAEPGDVTRERLDRILARAPAAVLLNDPTLLSAGRVGSGARGRADPL